MVINPWDPQAQVGPAPGVGPAPVNVQTPFSNVNNRGGMFGGAVGTLASAAIPGAGAIGTGIGTGIDVRGANNQLEQLGIGRSVAFGPSFANSMSFGLAGRSARDQFQDAVTRAYPGLLQALTPAPPVSAPASFEGTPSMGFFDGINDMNNVGNLGATLDARGVPGGYSGGYEGGGSFDGGFGSGADNMGGDVGSDHAYRTGGYVQHDGDRRLEPVKATLHEGEFVIRPEAVKKIGVDNLKKLNAMAMLLREGR